MCGWFHEVSTNIFGVQDRSTIWVVLHRNNANKWFCIAYDSKYSGDSGLKRTIDCDMIKTVDVKRETDTIEMIVGKADSIPSREALRLVAFTPGGCSLSYSSCRIVERNCDMGLGRGHEIV